MANKPKDQKKTDAEVEAINNAYKLAKRDYDEEVAKLKQELETKIGQHEAIGGIKKIRTDRDFNDLLEAIILFRIKESRAYKTYGYTWEQFCEKIGIPWRTADKIIEDLRPVFIKFSAKFADFIGVEFNKIRHLGRAISAKFADFDEKDLTPEDIDIIIEQHKAAHKKELEEKDAVIRTKDRLLEGKDEVIHKQEKTLKRLEQVAEERGLSPEDYAFLQKMDAMKIQWDMWYMQNLEPTEMWDLLSEDKPVTVRMRAAYLSTLKYIKMQIMAAWDTAEGMYLDAAMEPEIAYIPPPKIERIGE